MGYKREHYNAVLNAIRERCGEEWYASVDWPTWGVIWRKQIKERLFDQNFLIADIIAALDEALGKRKWPVGTAFIHRIEDVCWVNRRYREPVVKINQGMQGIGSLLGGGHDTQRSLPRLQAKDSA